MVGAFCEASYERQVVHLEAGETLCIYTDGITEASDQNWEPFGEEHLEEILLESRDLELKALVQRILVEVSTYAGVRDQQDDQTLVLARVV